MLALILALSLAQPYQSPPSWSPLPPGITAGPVSAAKKKQIAEHQAKMRKASDCWGQHKDCDCPAAVTYKKPCCVAIRECLYPGSKNPPAPSVNKKPPKSLKDAKRRERLVP